MFSDNFINVTHKLIIAREVVQDKSNVIYN